MDKDEAIMILTARAKVLKASKKLGKIHASKALGMAIEALQEPERPKGHWVKGRELADHEKGSYHIINDFIYCSNCTSEAYWDTDYGQQEFDYCPYCGADMKGEEE